MRGMLSLAALIAALVLSGVAPAGDDKPGRETRETAATEGPMSMRPAADDDYMAEPCWGDRYEKDEDLNEGARISTEEILRVINPLQS
jgi:hypothetical protein